MSNAVETFPRELTGTLRARQMGRAAMGDPYCRKGSWEVHGPIVPVSPTEVVGWSLPPGRGPVTLPFSLEARSWGVHSLGALWVRSRRPGGYTFREQKVTPAAG